MVNYQGAFRPGYRITIKHFIVVIVPMEERERERVREVMEIGAVDTSPRNIIRFFRCLLFIILFAA